LPSRRDGGTCQTGGFPRPGTLEALASGRSLDRLAAAAATQHPASRLGRRAAEHGTATASDVVQAARDGDDHAASILRMIGERLGVGIANVIHLLDPEVMVIGGGVAQAHLLLRPARDTPRRLLLPGVGEHTRIRLACLGPEAGVCGAALLAGEELAGAAAAPHVA
jgi:glucokinase